MNMDILMCIMLLRYSLKIKNGVGFYGIEMDSILRNSLIPGIGKNLDWKCFRKALIETVCCIERLDIFTQGHSS